MLTARQQAARSGAKTYDAARECTRCGARERYVSNGACVHCMKMRNGSARNPDYIPDPARAYNKRMAMELRQVAAEQGQTIYEGNPCKKCGGTSRYVSNGSCTHCMVSTATALREKLKEARARPQPQPFILQPCGCKEHAELFARLPYLEGRGVVYANCDMTHAARDRKGDMVKTTGKCILCHPNELITFTNMYNARALPGLDQLCFRILFDTCSPDGLLAENGRGFASLQLARLRQRWYDQHGKEYKAPVPTGEKETGGLSMPLAPLPLPGGQS